MERKVERVEFDVPSQPKLTRVAAYARVSSGKDAMLHSLSAQVTQYSNMIQNHTGWLYCGVYADEALTGTKDNRAEFVRLMDDCKAGKIDLIITKSISRFARNTVTLLQTARELKLLGVDIYFEEQNIHTMSADGELMLTILASYAQEESLSASENQKWRIKKNFEEGFPWNQNMLGYRQVHGELVIVPEEAEIVKSIFADYLSGLGILAIAQKLNEQGTPTRMGHSWGHSAIGKILQNPTYTGCLVLQRTYRENHLTKKTLKNNGQFPIYHVDGSHEAIISKETFDAVQAERNRRAKRHHTKPTTNTYPLTSLLVCENCGKNYRRKITRTGAVWVCSTYNQLGKAVCASKQIPETTLISTLENTLGIKVTTAEEVKKVLAKIVVQSGNRLTFRLTDGTEKTTTWKDRSRSESWTPEMRKAVGEKTKRRNAKCQEQ